MNRQAISLLRKVLPHGCIEMLRPLYTVVNNLGGMFYKRKTQQIFSAASDTPAYLDISELETLQKKYQFPPEYGYDPRITELRGKERAKRILRLPKAQEPNSFLELGCGDGMVCCALSRKGKVATAIDFRDVGFDQRAASEGVRFCQMDATNLQFEDESFDFVFSYGAFEHFSSPEDVLREAIRVVRKGGHIYLDFGPLYYSPYGEHAYRSISVPYCQFLWPKDLINEFCEQNKLKPIDFSHVNGWSLERYRNLWSKYSHILKKVRYNEICNLSHLSLIRRFPSCFKSKFNFFDNFIVSSISVLFQKLDQELSNKGMNSDIKS